MIRPDTAIPEKAGTDESADSSAKVGPNAVLQLHGALRDRMGEGAAQEVFGRAGLVRLLSDPPADMVDEKIAALLFQSLFQSYSQIEACRIAGEAGRRTASYLLANRIPGAAQTILRLLPASFAAPILTRAIARNAWTFAGSGHFSYRTGSPIVLQVKDNPLAMPGCVWHVAVFETLYRSLASPHTRVFHDGCCLSGAPVCTFRVDIHADNI